MAESKEVGTRYALLPARPLHSSVRNTDTKEIPTSTPRARWPASVESASEADTVTAVLESEATDLTKRLREAEFRLMLEAAAARILGLAPAEVGEHDPDEP